MWHFSYSVGAQWVKVELYYVIYNYQLKKKTTNPMGLFALYHWVNFNFIFLLGKYLIPPLGVGAHQRQGKIEEGKTSEKSEEERDREIEGEPSYHNQGNWRAHRGWRTERKTEEEKERNRAGPQLSYPGSFGRLLRLTYNAIKRKPTRIVWIL